MVDPNQPELSIANQCRLLNINTWLSMYFGTTRRQNKDGLVVEYYPLAFNEHHPVTGKTVTKIIHNFGRSDQLDRDQLVRLWRSIARVCNLTVSDPYSQERDQPAPTAASLPGGLKIDRTVALGTVLAIEELWERIGLKKTLDDIAKTTRSPAVCERALFAMTVIRQAAHYDGKWVIKTNDDTISLEDAACGYKELMVIERCFRSLKRTQIKMTPMYHWLSRRIECHVKICVPALLIERIAQRACDMPGHRIRRALEPLQLTKLFNLNRRVTMCSEISKETCNMLKKRDIKSPPQVVHLENHPPKQLNYRDTPNLI